MRDFSHKKDIGMSKRYKGESGVFLSKKVIIIAIIVIVVLGLAIVAFFLMPKINLGGINLDFLKNLFMKVAPGIETNESKAAVQNIIGAYDGINIYTLNLSALTAIGKPAVPSLARILENESSTADKRYAALLGLSAIGHNDSSVNVLSYLKNSLDDPDVNVRVTAAELAMSFGSKEGIPVLIAELENEAILKPSEPVMPINSHCALLLGRYTTQTFGIDKVQWQGWWDSNKNNLKFNKEDGKFTI
ncbi:MAG: HEAT repeat domain-containing protein [Candidatus Pacearchaeota archaeon]